MPAILKRCKGCGRVLRVDRLGFCEACRRAWNAVYAGRRRA